MDKAIKAAARAFVVIGGIINSIFLFTSNTGNYTMWALTLVLIAVALLIASVSPRNRIQE